MSNENSGKGISTSSGPDKKGDMKVREPAVNASLEKVTPTEEGLLPNVDGYAAIDLCAGM